MSYTYQSTGPAAKPTVDPITAVIAFAMVTFTIVACLIGIWAGSWQWAATGVLPAVAYQLYSRRK